MLVVEVSDGFHFLLGVDWLPSHYLLVRYFMVQTLEVLSLEFEVGVHLFLRLLGSERFLEIGLRHVLRDAFDEGILLLNHVLFNDWCAYLLRRFEDLGFTGWADDHFL